MLDAETGKRALVGGEFNQMATGALNEEGLGTDVEMDEAKSRALRGDFLQKLGLGVLGPQQTRNGNAPGLEQSVDHIGP